MDISGVIRVVILLSVFMGSTSSASRRRKPGADDALVIVSEGFHSRGGVPVLAISCSAPSGNATDEDDPQLNWYNPAGELINASGSNFFTRQEASNKLTLYVQHMTFEDQGHYKCTGFVGGRTRQAFTDYLMISQPLQDISFADTASEQQLVSQTDGLIRCRATGVPKPRIAWKHRGRRIYSGGRYYIESNGLRIMNVTDSDSGRYACRAFTPGNRKRRKTFQIQMTVVAPPAQQDGTNGTPIPSPLGCIDMFGQLIEEGIPFKPRDICESCMCTKGGVTGQCVTEECGITPLQCRRDVNPGRKQCCMFICDTPSPIEASTAAPPTPTTETMNTLPLSEPVHVTTLPSATETEVSNRINPLPDYRPRAMSTPHTNQPSTMMPDTEASSMPTARLNFHKDCEQTINVIINSQFNAYYVYISMSSYYGRTTIAMPGLTVFFQTAAQNKRRNAESLISYQNMRGGEVRLFAIPKPTVQSWASVSSAMTVSHHLERTLDEELLLAHQVASRQDDPNMQFYLKSKLLESSAYSLKETADYVTQLSSNAHGRVSGKTFDTAVSQKYRQCPPVSDVNGCQSVPTTQPTPTVRNNCV